MKNDRELCTAAVAQNGDILRELANDRELCTAADAQSSEMNGDRWQKVGKLGSL